MKKPRTDETAANVKSSQRDARSGSLERMVRRRFIWEIVAYIVWCLVCAASGIWHVAMIDPLDSWGRDRAGAWLVASFVAILGFGLWRRKHWPPMN